MKKSELGEIAVMMSPRAEKASPVRKTTGKTHNASGDCARPRAAATTSTAVPESTLLLAAQTASPMTTSSSVTGALMIASHVFWTCIREKPEYIASNDALIMVLEHTMPEARKAI